MYSLPNITGHHITVIYGRWEGREGVACMPQSRRWFWAYLECSPFIQFLPQVCWVLTLMKFVLVAGSVNICDTHSNGNTRSVYFAQIKVYKILILYIGSIVVKSCQSREKFKTNSHTHSTDYARNSPWILPGLNLNSPPILQDSTMTSTFMRAVYLRCVLLVERLETSWYYGTCKI